MSEAINPSKIGAEICGRLGLDPSKTKDITIRLARGVAEVEVTRFLTDGDAKLIGETISRFKLVEA